MRRLVIALGVLAMLVFAAPASGGLCETCKGRYYPGDLGRCVVCGGETGGGAFVLCKKCSARLGQCEHCRSPLKGTRPVLKSARVDTKKSGAYALGKWKYEYTIGAAGTRNENRLGRLTYDGKPVAGSKEYDRIWTPWGLMQHFDPDVDLTRHMVHAGWLLKRYRDSPLYLETGRLLPSPDAPANPPAPLELDDSANGKTVSAVVWQKIIIRLDSNPRPWYWSIAKVEGEGQTIVHVDNGKYVSRDHKGAKVPGRFIFTFLATRPGIAKLTLKYRKASRRKMQAPAIKTFTLTVAVKPDLAVERVKKLKADIDKFKLSLRYHDEQSKTYYCLEMAVVSVGPPYATRPSNLLRVHIPKAQAVKIIDYLASDGFIGRSMNLSGIKLAKPPEGPTYVMTVSAGGLVLYENLGWRLPMLKRLDGLRKDLDVEVAKAKMDRLLSRMSGLRKKWEKSAAVKPVVKPPGPPTPDKSPLHEQLAKVCGLSDRQQKKIADLVAGRDKALNEFHAGMVVEMTVIKRMVAEARRNRDRDAEKKAFAKMRSLQAREGQIKRDWQAKIIAVLTAAQKARWYQHRAMLAIERKFWKANLTEDQAAKIKAAYAKFARGVDLDDEQARREVLKKLTDYITSEILTDAQRKAMKPPPEPVVVPERGLER